MKIFNPHELQCWITGQTSDKGNGQRTQPVKQLFEDGSERQFASITEASKTTRKDVGRMIGKPFIKGMRFVYD